MKTRRSAALLGLLFALSGEAFAETYHVVDIGVLEGFADGTASGINDAGLVVGTLFASSTDTRAFRYTASEGPVLLEGFFPGTPAAAFAVNDAGVAVGRAGVAFGGLSAVRWSSEGVAELLGSAATSSVSITARAINDLGAAAGSSSTITFPPSSSALHWTPEGELGVPIGADSARGINDAGQIVGTFGKTFLTTGAFRWTEAGGSEELIGLPTATTSSANGINDAGVAVGTSGTSSSSTLATSWATPTDPLSLGVLSGGTRSTANAINDAGVIVGFSDTESGQHAIVWTAADGMRDLNDLSDAAEIGMTLTDAAAINSHGAIVGYGDVAGHLHGFVATPLPEPASAWPALAMLFVLRRRG